MTRAGDGADEPRTMMHPNDNGGTNMSATATAQRLHLWQITDAEEALAEKLEEAGGELTPELEAEWERLEGSFEDKVERTALYVRELEANAKAAKEEADRLDAIRKALQRRADGLKGYLQFHMQRTGREKVETPRARVRVQKNSRPSISWMGDPEAAPEPFRRVRVDVDGTAVYEHWKAGQALPDGFVVQHGSHLRIQ